MLRNCRRNFEIIQLLLHHLARVPAHDEVYVVRFAIDLLKQSLQINCSACTSRRDHQFHILSFRASEAYSRNPAEQPAIMLNEFDSLTSHSLSLRPRRGPFDVTFVHWKRPTILEIGRASCRERV